MRDKMPQRALGLFFLGLFVSLNMIIALLAISVRAQPQVPKVPIILDDSVVNQLGKSVLYMTNELETNGGTGFQVRAPSGKIYVLTNEHICTHMQEKGTVKVTDEWKRVSHPKVLKISQTSDLCLLEGVPDVPALSLGRDNYPGLYGMIVGHPGLRPLEYAAGVFVELGPVTFQEVMAPGQKCEADNKFLKLEVTPLGIQRICYQVRYAYTTSVPVYPGNSGSPVLDLDGRVVGVAFACNTITHWGYVVPLQEVKNFLQGY